MLVQDKVYEFGTWDKAVPVLSSVLQWDRQSPVTILSLTASFEIKEMCIGHRWK